MVNKMHNIQMFLGGGYPYGMELRCCGVAETVSARSRKESVWNSLFDIRCSLFASCEHRNPNRELVQPQTGSLEDTEN